ncbi:hypothetical protein C8J56DRAFT_1049027 [Mycena floridula]|nr:hypothetical protein C8J56DRAFT_1049027 [Mycena floridula]
MMEEEPFVDPQLLRFHDLEAATAMEHREVLEDHIQITFEADSVNAIADPAVVDNLVSLTFLAAVSDLPWNIDYLEPMCRIGGIRIGCEGRYSMEYFHVTSGTPYDLVLGREWIGRNADLIPFAQRRAEKLSQQNAWVSKVEEEIFHPNEPPPDELNTLWNGVINDDSLEKYWSDWIQHNTDNNYELDKHSDKEEIPLVASVMSVFATPDLANPNPVPNGISTHPVINNPANNNSQTNLEHDAERERREEERRNETRRRTEEFERNKLNARIAYS